MPISCSPRKKEEYVEGVAKKSKKGGREGGKTTGSSSAVINLGSDTGLRGLASTAPHNWVTHRGRPTQAIMWRSVGRGLAEVGEGVHKHTHADISSFVIKTTQPSFTQWEITEV